MARGSPSNIASSRPSTASPCVAGWRDSVPPAPHSCSGWGMGCARSRPPRWTISGTTPWSKATKTQRTDFGSVKPGERKILDGPFEWAGIKSKYFFTAALAVEENQPRFGATIVEGGPRTVSASSLFARSAVATRTAVGVTLPVPPASPFYHQWYVGTLEYRRLSPLGHDLHEPHPYGGVPPAD